MRKSITCRLMIAPRPPRASQQSGLVGKAAIDKEVVVAVDVMVEVEVAVIPTRRSRPDAEIAGVREEVIVHADPPVEIRVAGPRVANDDARRISGLPIDHFRLTAAQVKRAARFGD